MKKRNRAIDLLIDLTLVAATALVISLLSEASGKSVDIQTIRTECDLVGYHDCDRVVTLAKYESEFDPSEYNPEKHGSYGLLQIQCTTAQMFGLGSDCKKLFNLKTNIKYGVKYLEHIEEKLKQKNLDGS